MGYELRIIAPAINRMLVLRAETFKAYRAAGVNIVAAVQSAVRFNMALAKTKIALEAIYKSTASKFFPILTKNLDTFRKNLYANMPKIIAGLERFVNFVFKAFEATWILGQRVWSILSRIYDFFYELHKATDGWSTVILGVIVAWKALNLAFLATPLGMIITGLVAILALYDDFKVWQEGGESFFNWKPVVPIINAVSQALSTLWDILTNTLQTLGWVVVAFEKLFKLDFSGLGDALMSGLEKFNNMLAGIVQMFLDIENIAAKVGRVLGNTLGGVFGDNASNLQNNPVVNGALPGATVGRPLGTNVSNQNQSNQNVQQQTSIVVQGSADAKSVGNAVANEQSRVNFDMVRNLRGATR